MIDKNKKEIILQSLLKKLEKKKKL